MGYPVPAGEIKSCEASGATITMTRPTKRWTQIEAKKTFAGLTRAWPLSKSAMIPRRHGWLHSGYFNAVTKTNLPMRSAARSRRLSRRSANAI
jgi:hypothetical protein